MAWGEHLCIIFVFLRMKIYYGNKGRQMRMYMCVYICRDIDIIYRDTDDDIDISWDSHFPLKISNRQRFNFNYQSIEIIQRATAQPWFPNNDIDSQTLKVYTIKNDLSYVHLFIQRFTTACHGIKNGWVDGKSSNNVQYMTWQMHMYCCVLFCRGYMITAKLLIEGTPNPVVFYLIHWSQVLSREWRFSWSSADRRCSNYIWVDQQFYFLLCCK